MKLRHIVIERKGLMLTIRKELMKAYAHSPNLGCDPEFFFKDKDGVVGAEKVLPKAGISLGGASKIIIDGVQAELNPHPSHCRALLGNEISLAFRTLQTELKKQGKGMVADFSRTIEISKEKLMELNEESRKFGCAPSTSIYASAPGVKITDVDPTEYRTRAAGGHIHIGHSGNPNLVRALVTDVQRTVLMLDLLVGNTSVLIDRDEGNIERRKVYGKAGEYRSPKHGLEYRTLSNYWLTSSQLFSFAFGMARLAAELMSDPKNTELFYKEFTSKVKAKNVKDAINNNDFDLAMENFLAIERLIIEVSQSGGRYAIHGQNMQAFHYFVKMIKDKGLNHWFPQDPIDHWTSTTDCHNTGFSDYLVNVVTPQMNSAVVKETKAA